MKQKEPTTPPQEELPLQKQINPIVCPECGSRELAYIPEYHKCIGTRILLFLNKIVIIVTGFMYLLFIIDDIFSLPNTSVDFEWVYALVISAFTYLLFYVHIIETESRTHVKIICKDCGHTWLLEEK